MFRIRITDKTEDQEIIKMTDIPYNSVAIVVNNEDGFNGHYVVKISSNCYLDLTDGNCLDHAIYVLVKLLPPCEKVTVEFFNEE